MIAYGCVQKDHSVHVNRDNGWEITYDFPALLTSLRQQHGEIVVFVSEGLAFEQFRFEIDQKPF